MLTLERLRGLIDYNADTGAMTWRVKRGRTALAGGICGTPHPHDRYLMVKIDGRSYKLHRLAWLYVYGEWPTEDVDHIDGDRGNNRIANLRALSRKENAQNRRRAHAGNLTGLLGVSPWAKKYRARIMESGVQRHLGLFDTAEEAHAAYVAAKRRLHPAGTL